MKVPAIFYSETINCLVIVRGKSIDRETGDVCIPVEWDWADMIEAQKMFGFGDEASLFNIGEFEHVGDL